MTGWRDERERLREVWEQVKAVEETSADIAARAREFRAAKTPRQEDNPPPMTEEAELPVAAVMLPRDDDPVSALADVDLPPMTARLRTALGTSVWAGTVESGSAATELWSIVRNRYEQTGWWPLLIEPWAWHRIKSTAALPNTDLDGTTWLAQRWAECTEACDDPKLGAITSTAGPFHPHNEVWTERWAARNERRPYTELALVGAPYPWLVPALLGWRGAVNMQLTGREHAAVLRHWSTRWGAEPLAFGEETMHLRVRRPPRTVAAASTAALEGWLYCPDTCEGGQYGEIPMARGFTSSLWPFWWD